MINKRIQYRRTPTGIGVLVPAGASIGANYHLQIAGEETVARILEWFARGRPFQWYMDVVRNPNPGQRNIIATRGLGLPRA